MTLVILFSLKTMEPLENGLQPHSGVTSLFLMRTESLASLQSCHSVDADALCKRTIRIWPPSSTLGPQGWMERCRWHLIGPRAMIWGPMEQSSRRSSGGSLESELKCMIGGSRTRQVAFFTEIPMGCQPAVILQRVGGGGWTTLYLYH